MTFDQTILQNKIMPILVADSIAQVVEDATAYRDAGYAAVEILCRTPAAVPAIREARKSLPELLVGGGTVLNLGLAEQVFEAGGQFLVSPACDPAIIEFARQRKLPLIPGIFTPTEVAIALRHGFRVQKLFPAVEAGGVPYLNGLASPFGHTDLQLVLGNGISKQNVLSFLKHPLVGAVIADWLVPLRGEALREELAETRKMLQILVKGQ